MIEEGIYLKEEREREGSCDLKLWWRIDQSWWEIEVVFCEIELDLDLVGSSTFTSDFWPLCSASYYYFLIWRILISTPKFSGNVIVKLQVSIINRSAVNVTFGQYLFNFDNLSLMIIYIIIPDNQPLMAPVLFFFIIINYLYTCGGCDF